MGMFEMMSVLGPSFMMFMLPALLLPFLYIYLLHDYTGRREGKRDPMLGAKVFATLLMTMCVQLGLAGLAIIGVALVQDYGADDLVKTGSGLILAGVIVGAYPTYLFFTKIRSPAGANIAHQALGLNALFTGMVFLVATVVLCQALFHDGDLAELAVITGIYGVAMSVTASMLLKNKLPPATVRSEGDS